MQRFQKLRDSAYKSALGSNYMEQGKYAEAIASTGAEPDAVDPKTPVGHGWSRRTCRPEPQPQAATPTLGIEPDAARSSPSGLPRAALVLADLDGDGALDAVAAGVPALRVLRGEKPQVSSTPRRSSASRACRRPRCSPATTTTTAELTCWCSSPAASRCSTTSRQGFKDVTAAAKLPAFPFVSVSAAWVDIDHDGDVDLFVGGLADTSAAAAGEAGGLPSRLRTGAEPAAAEQRRRHLRRHHGATRRSAAPAARWP